MNKTLSGLCFAAAFGLAATLGAQSTTTSQSATTAKGDHDVTVTGCLAKGAGGGYMLSNARVDPAGASTTTAAGSTSTTTASGSTTAGTATTTGGTATTTAATGTTGANANSPAMTWMLSGNSDLEKHVGHKIQVSGKSAWNGAMDRGRTTTTASGTGTTASTGTTAAAGTTTPGSAADQPRLDVTSIKMVSSSCS